jgi:hypothetical protein
VKSGKKYGVAYKVTGSLNELTRDDLVALAVKQLRGEARAYCVRKLNEAEPAIVKNIEMKSNMIEAGIVDESTAVAFFAKLNMPLEIPSTFEIPVSELLPGESTRGKKAGDIFSFESEEEEDDTEDVVE